MDTSLFSSSLLLLLLSLFFLQHPISGANLHKIKQLRSDFLSQSTSSDDTPPTEYFEVTRPIELPKTKPCSYLVLHHDFGYTYGKPPVLANYTPPSHCPSQRFSTIVLEWKATCKGRQFDRIFGVWLGGVEILRSCTAEPRATGIVWTVEKDITRYHSLLLSDQTLAVYLGNLVDQTYTGVYHVDITIHFYPDVKTLGDDESKSGTLAFGNGFPADLILPISRDLPLNDGLWFEIENSTDVGLKEFKIPQNAYRAVLEVYVSFHENDEFWYTNPPNEYLFANNLTDTPGNGPFREVVVTLDGNVVGSVWPFTVIYTGGVNPLLWRPITGIGSFDLPSYEIEITPVLGTILDGEIHSLGFSVTNALNVWYIDANLHLWLDTKSSRTEGELLNRIDKPLVESLVSDFKGLNGTFWTSAKRSILSTGWVRSSHGNITTSLVQDFTYSNSVVIGKNGSKQTVNQIIFFNDSVYAKLPPSSYDFIDETHRTFSLYLDSDELDQDNDTYLSVSNVTLGFDVNKSKSTDFRFSKSSLKNAQDGQGTMVVRKNLVVSGLGETQQDYRYKSYGFCYFRKVGSSNYTILYDKVRNSCNKRSHSRSGRQRGTTTFLVTKKHYNALQRVHSSTHSYWVAACIFCHQRRRTISECFFHPDLGIGGAERVIVDAAVELASHGHNVHIFTAHHDRSRCFEETTAGIFPVTVYGSFLPWHIFYRLHALCAYLRCLFVAFCVLFMWPSFDVILADQVSVVIPILKLKRSAEVVFYCHFPDLLLAQHSTFLRRMYRKPIDYIEEITTGMADLIFVNSNFTASTFANTFKLLDAQGIQPAVQYPPVKVDQFNEPHSSKLNFLSINRFERKKNIELAISTFAMLHSPEGVKHQDITNTSLTVAGGFDIRVKENVEYLEELKNLEEREGMSNKIRFVTSCSTDERNALLSECLCVLYTPKDEHFGIVPLEAMAAYKPVIACNSGGPVESIKNGVTGYLCDPTPQEFSIAMAKLVQDPEGAERMGREARRHVTESFSTKTFGQRLNRYLVDICRRKED